MTKRGEPLPINGALNRPRTKLGLELSAWMSIVFVTVTVFLAGFKWLAIFSFPALLVGAWLATRSRASPRLRKPQASFARPGSTPIRFRASLLDRRTPI